MRYTRAVLSAALAATILAVHSRTRPAATAPPTPAPASAARLPSGQGIPEPVIPLGLGVEIHFIEPRARDLDMIAAAGFRFVRMDFHWHEVERRKGEYDFSAYERLVDALAARRIRPYFILDYGSPHYDNNLAPHTVAGRQAFARFAAAGAAKFKGRGVLWELWNEPNVQFWKPHPNVADYVALAKATFPAMRRADPGATLLAPAAALFDLHFLERCFERGLLELVDAVSVHPYGRYPPEKVTEDWHHLRVLIARYAPAGKADMPVLAGEWGYSGAFFSRESQADLLPRMFLTNMMNDIPLSIWYDFRDDGTNPKEPEHNYGLVTTEYEPKAVYHVARTLMDELPGFRFVKRLSLTSDNDYAALFTNGREQKIAMWTTGAPHRVALPLDTPVVVAGKSAVERLSPAGGTLSVELSTRPQYLAPTESSRDLQIAAAWRVESRPAFSAGVAAESPNAPRLRVVITNPLRTPLSGVVEAAVPRSLAGSWTGSNRFRLQPGETARLVWQGTFPLREERSFRVPVTVRLDGEPAPLRQEIAWTVTNPLRVRPSLRGDGTLLEVENPSGEPFDGVVKLSPTAGTASTSAGRRDPLGLTRTRVRLARGERRKTFNPDGLAMADVQSRLQDGSKRLTFSGSILTPDEQRSVAAIPPLSFQAAEWFASPARASAYEVVLDGNAAVPATADLRVTPAPGDGTAPNQAPPKAQGPTPKAQASRPKAQDPRPKAAFAARVAYDFGGGGRFLRVTPRGRMMIEGKPKAVGMWIHNSSATGDGLRCRFVDANGTFFQPTATERLTWQGWRWVTMPLDDPNIEHWDGAGDQIDYPIRWDTLLLIESSGAPHKATVHFTGVTLIYEE